MQTKRNSTKTRALPEFASVTAMLQRKQPILPVYCIYPDLYRAAAEEFIAGFAGRVLYAVKSNDHPDVIRYLVEGGIRHFDCASVPEIESVKRICPEAQCYFMTPVRLRDAARVAQAEFGVRHFMLDHLSGVEPLLKEIDARNSVVFARMAVHHKAAMQDLSVRFGAPPAEIPALLTAIRATGAEPALGFNVGSNVRDPEAYFYAIELAARILAELPFMLRLVDIGGGFPRSYPGFAAPPLVDYFRAARSAATALPLTDASEILVEPGRALSAPGLSAVVEVLLRKEGRLYLNDGMYGIFWELRFKGHERFPVRAFRNARPLDGPMASFTLHGPTCDSTDTLPGAVELPSDIQPGDHLEFGNIGAYSLAGRTNFNGFFSDDIVTISDDRPPMCDQTL
jgi:ornithine decarboxylase